MSTQHELIEQDKNLLKCIEKKNNQKTNADDICTIIELSQNSRKLPSEKILFLWKLHKFKYGPLCVKYV